MKSVSSAIVVLAGIFAIVSTTPLFVATDNVIPIIGLTAGIVTLALGLVGWIASLKYDR